MSKERATWNSRYEKGLVDIMRDHVNVEGWRSISEKFTQMYPLAPFTKQQLQEKEKELKGSWKAIHVARKESGVGWNDTLAMVIAEPEKWKKLITDNGKMAKCQKKPFPLYDECTSLYAGSVATGDLNFTSTEHLLPAPAAPLVPTVGPAAPAAPPAPVAPPALAAPAAPAESTRLTTPFDRLDVSSAHNEAQSTGDSIQGVSGGRKRKQSLGAAIDGFVQFKMTQTSKTMKALEEKKKQDEQFSVDKCLDEVDANIFKSEIDRECYQWRQC
ncbi:uncharacterized protein LOC8084490 [Sorghum bicolor]|uniref:uncharacterized protein LOC8084490 n=1 Tax=Sorghum bicolor TaxID=4558 RepID=UPI000B423F78|nr:uncharacterized protein LOC8084490 [Sorghum bicolor]|eukprot:XP_021315186.1 uncharacterized protein LOC8084490 [Sorghum bicolor]